MKTTVRRYSRASVLLTVAVTAWLGWTPHAARGEAACPPPCALFSGEVGPEDAMQAAARSGDRVVAVGSKGVVLVSTDGAHTWAREPIEGRPPLIDVTACPDGRFFLLDFRRGLWSREAASDPWTRSAIRAPEYPEAPRSLALRCDAAGRLWAVGEESSILRSDDRGRSWRATLPDRTDRLLTAVGFVDANRVRVVGEFGSYFESEDGGARWRRGPDLPGELYPHAAHVAVDNRVWVVANTGLVYRLDPGAARWVQEDTGTTRALYGVGPVGEHLVAVGAGGIALVRGRAWDRLTLEPATGVARDWRGVVELDGGAWVAVGPAGVARVKLVSPQPIASMPGDR